MDGFQPLNVFPSTINNGKTTRAWIILLFADRDHEPLRFSIGLVKYNNQPLLFFHIRIASIIPHGANLCSEDIDR